MPKEEIAIDLLEEGLGRGEEVVLSTTGESMMPLLRPGEAFRIKRIPWHQIKVGDIVCFENAKEVVVHRVVKQYWQNGQRFFITKGDRVFYLDKPISDGKILARVVQIGNLRLDYPFQERLAQVVARFFYWHYWSYHAFWQIPGIEFLGRLKQHFISRRSVFTPLYMRLLSPLYQFLSSLGK